MEIPARVRKGDYSGGASSVYDRILKTVKELEGKGDIYPDTGGHGLRYSSLTDVFFS